MVTTAKAFLQQGLQYVQLHAFLARRLVHAGYVDVQLFRTPIGTRVVIFADRPAMVIGRRGANVRELQELLQSKFGLENPQIDVIEVANPDLNAKVVAYGIARAMARGIKFRRAAFVALRRVMEAGARGVEVVISGKLTSQRARFERYRAGVVYKSGMPREVVDEAAVHVLLKPGMYGVKVRIMPPVEVPGTIKLIEGGGVG
ncbi:MAG: 30S ribosomal protein S3 [Thermoprotei archaeon]|nr:MAG: 30S ribosomal protein S3 [Thermoprotei archaeon]